MFASRGFRFASLFACIVMAVSMVSVDQAEARRGGSFGSRGTRTFQSAPVTNTAPNRAAPVQRTTTPNAQQNDTARPNTATAQQRGGFMNGFGGSMLRGLMFGGLLGLLLGSGFGGIVGLFGLLVQALLIGGAIFLVMRMFKSRAAFQPAMAGAGVMNRSSHEPAAQQNPLGGLGLGGQARSPKASPRKTNTDEIGISPADLDTFQTMLAEVQSAFGREDYAALRHLTTPEMMSYLSEELGENATRGVRNEVSEIELLQGDLAESWREGNVDYATTAMRYSSIDVTRERDSGRVVEGDAGSTSETTELWTFTRQHNTDWKLSAIQQA